jgi:hypothetical protein
MSPPVADRSNWLRLTPCRRFSLAASRRHGGDFGTLACALPCSLRRTLGLGCRLRSSSNQPQAFSHFCLKLRGSVFVIFQELAGIFAALANALSLVAVASA